MSESKYRVTLTTTTTHVVTKRLEQETEDMGDLTTRRDYVLTVASRLPGPFTAEFLHVAEDAVQEAGAPADAEFTAEEGVGDAVSFAEVRWSRVIRDREQAEPVNDSTEGARPFRVGDRVRISGWGSHGPHEGAVVRIDPADPGRGFGPYIATDCQYMTDRGELAIATCAMTSDLTAGSGCTVELIEPAPQTPADTSEVTS